MFRGALLLGLLVVLVAAKYPQKTRPPKIPHYSRGDYSINTITTAPETMTSPKSSASALPSNGTQESLQSSCGGSSSQTAASSAQATPSTASSAQATPSTASSAKATPSTASSAQAIPSIASSAQATASSSRATPSTASSTQVTPSAVPSDPSIDSATLCYIANTAEVAQRTAAAQASLQATYDQRAANIDAFSQGKEPGICSVEKQALNADFVAQSAEIVSTAAAKQTLLDVALAPDNTSVETRLDDCETFGTTLPAFTTALNDLVLTFIIQTTKYDNVIICL